jgi:hypothetical protein
MPVTSFRLAAVERQIGWASYTVTMLQRAVVEMERSSRDSSVARHYLRETGQYLQSLKDERRSLQVDTRPVEPAGLGETLGHPVPTDMVPGGWQDR